MQSFIKICSKILKLLHIYQIGHFLDIHNPAYVFWTCPFLMCHFPEVYLWIYLFQGFIQALTDIILNWVLKLNPINQEIKSNKNYLDCLESLIYSFYTFHRNKTLDHCISGGLEPWTIASMEVSKGPNLSPRSFYFLTLTWKREEAQATRFHKVRTGQKKVGIMNKLSSVFMPSFCGIIRLL